jgi:hypothetical protein
LQLQQRKILANAIKKSRCWEPKNCIDESGAGAG